MMDIPSWQRKHLVTVAVDTWARELEKWWPSLRVQKYFGELHLEF